MVDREPEVDLQPAHSLRPEVGIDRLAGERRMGFVDTGVPHLVVQVDDAGAVDREHFAKFFRGMFRRGVLLPPSQFECGFLSTAHGPADIDATLAAAREAFAEVGR